MTAVENWISNVNLISGQYLCILVVNLPILDKFSDLD